MLSSERKVGWFADQDEETKTGDWQPCLETGTGVIPAFEIWFPTKAECEAWIAEHVLGVGWLPGEPTFPQAEQPVPPPHEMLLHPKDAAEVSRFEAYLATVPPEQQPVAQFLRTPAYYIAHTSAADVQTLRIAFGEEIRLVLDESVTTTQGWEIRAEPEITETWHA